MEIKVASLGEGLDSLPLNVNLLVLGRCLVPGIKRSTSSPTHFLTSPQETQVKCSPSPALPCPVLQVHTYQFPVAA